MGTHITNINPTQDTLVIEATGQAVAHGETVEVDTEVAKSLLEQDTVWARATTKKSKKATQDDAPEIDPTDVPQDLQKTETEEA